MSATDGTSATRGGAPEAIGSILPRVLRESGFTRRQRTSSVSAQITQAPYDCHHPFWSPDGKRLYFISLARERESLWSISAAGGTPQVAIENATRAAIALDGDTIAFLRDEQPADIVGAAALWFDGPASRPLAAAAFAVGGSLRVHDPSSSTRPGARSRTSAAKWPNR